jgi:hypothetical protein
MISGIQLPDKFLRKTEHHKHPGVARLKAVRVKLPLKKYTEPFDLPGVVIDTI